jgi:hypothetical protein
MFMLKIKNKADKPDETVTLQKSVLRGLMEALANDSTEPDEDDKLDEDEEEVMPHGRSRK